MRVDPIVPDAPPRNAPASAVGAGFDRLVEAAGSSLAAADAAESSFAAGRGGLTEMVVARARADIALDVATAAAQRAAQALNTLLGMQI